LLGVEDPDYVEHFTGAGLRSNLICGACSQHLDVIPENLRGVCPECFASIRDNGTRDRIVGLPELSERASSVYFKHEPGKLAVPIGRRILDVKPFAEVDGNLWVACLQDGQLIELDLDEGAIRPCGSASTDAVDLNQPVTLHLSKDGELAAIVNTRGRNGVVVDLRAGRPVMNLERGNYYTQASVYPLAFVEHQGRTVLIHGTEWNRLDISDPLTGELLTARPTPEHRGPHALDYFHGGLSVSPNGEWIVGNGWVWAPVGVVVSWNLRRWLAENVWESEDGPSRKALAERFYYWDGPLCWLDDRRLAVWGYGDDEENLIPAVRIFDVTTGAEERWFPGPNGTLVFDRFLFCVHANEGTSIWDAETGERLLHEQNFFPRCYHPGAKTFLSCNPDGSFTISRLVGHSVEHDWLRIAEGAVLRVATGIQEDKAFHCLPILADALEEAGCADEEILAHCRTPGPHGQHCWVVELLRGLNHPGA
jgi:hypothetical protein